MAKQENNYQCVPPERVAQLLKLGVGYEGYVESQKMPVDKTFVSVYPLREFEVLNKVDVKPHSINNSVSSTHGKYKIRYPKSKYIIKELCGYHVLTEGVGMAGLFHVGGYVMIEKYNGLLYASIGITARSQASNIGDVSYGGEVNLIVNNAIIDQKFLKPNNEPSIIAQGWSLVGSATLKLPEYADSDVYIKLRVGYIFSNETGRSPNIGTITFKIGEVQ